MVIGWNLHFVLLDSAPPAFELLFSAFRRRRSSIVFARWQGLVEDVRTIFERQNEYIYIPDLSPQS